MIKLRNIYSALGVRQAKRQNLNEYIKQHTLTYKYGKLTVIIFYIDLIISGEGKILTK